VRRSGVDVDGEVAEAEVLTRWPSDRFGIRLRCCNYRSYTVGSSLSFKCPLMGVAFRYNLGKFKSRMGV
jgi:hypothetical protein